MKATSDIYNYKVWPEEIKTDFLYQDLILLLLNRRVQNSSKPQISIKCTNYSLNGSWINGSLWYPI